MAVDPITVEIIRCALKAAANEMSTVLKKTAYNMMIYEVQDYCVSIVDHEGRTVSKFTVWRASIPATFSWSITRKSAASI
jgi:N-methylhydantoinase B/oxoprolinase/acetone carboxylase alpha subunit